MFKGFCLGVSRHIIHLITLCVLRLLTIDYLLAEKFENDEHDLMEEPDFESDSQVCTP